MLVSEMIAAALRLCRIRNTTEETLDEALKALNLMLKTWDESIVMPKIEEFTLLTTAGSYSIGSGGDFNTVKPLRILSAFITNSSGESYMVDKMSVKEYAKLNKTSPGRPNKLYYDSDYDFNLGMIYFNTVPSSSETLSLITHTPFTEYALTTEMIVQPTEYHKAMIYNLAVDLAPEYGMALMPTVIQQSLMLKDVIQRRNIRISNGIYDNALLE